MDKIFCNAGLVKKKLEIETIIKNRQANTDRMTKILLQLKEMAINVQKINVEIAEKEKHYVPKN